MGSINLYKIHNSKINLLMNRLKEEYEEVEEKVVTENKNGQKYTHILFTSKNAHSKNVSWKWIADEFGKSIPQVYDTPKAVLLIKTYKKDYYAVTFGHSYTLIIRYAERDFGLTFAKKISFEEIKTTAVVSPGMKRNKVINSFIDTDELEAESGEAFAKIKMRLEDSETKNLFKSAIEIGSSISLTILNDTCKDIMRVIEYVDEMMEKDDINEIPMFREVKDDVKIDPLT